MGDEFEIGNLRREMRVPGTCQSKGINLYFMLLCPVVGAFIVQGCSL